MPPGFPDGDVRVAEVQTAVGETADQAVPPPAVCLFRSQHPHLLLQSSTTTLTLSHVDQYFYNSVSLLGFPVQICFVKELQCWGLQRYYLSIHWLINTLTSILMQTTYL